VTMVFFLDGVFRNTLNSPIYEGIALYKALKEDNKIVILCDKKDEGERWLRENNIIKFDDIITAEFPGGSNKKLRQVEYVRSQGPITFVVTDDTELAKDLLEQGIFTILFLHPRYLRPEFRPDGRQGIRSWKSIEDELDMQSELYSQDPRVI
jgi:hypothetical protein